MINFELRRFLGDGKLFCVWFLFLFKMGHMPRNAVKL